MHRSRTILFGSLAVAGAALAALVASSGPRSSREAAGPAEGMHGTVLDPSWPKPDFTLTDTEGRAFDFRARTDGFVTLLFFGYTHCPDVCPIHMANIAAVLRDLDYAERSRIRVVFVTTDPERDTPVRIREWLDRFDRSFIGLRGAPEAIDAIQAAVHLPAAIRQPSRPGPLPGAYAVGHAAQVIAFTPDGRARVVYPFGTRQSDWAHDLPALLDAEAWPADEASPAAAGR